MLYRFTVPQYHRLIAEGILPEDGRYELLHGLVVLKDNGALGDQTMGHNPPHALVVALLSSLIARINSAKRHLRIQLPVIVGGDEAPEPDGSIVRGVARDYASHLPGGTDTSCVIEVADSSLERDEEEKLPAYAAAGIPQYVIVNLRTGTVDEHSEPNVQTGQYSRLVNLQRGAMLQLNLGDGETLDVVVDELLP